MLRVGRVSGRVHKKPVIVVVFWEVKWVIELEERLIFHLLKLLTILKIKESSFL